MLVRFRNGNKKIGKDTLTINFQAAQDCTAAALGLCQLQNWKRCYALKAERLYPSCLPFRRKQEKEWDSVDSYEFAEYIIDVTLRKDKKIKYLRYSESGDFRNQADIDKMSVVADLLKSSGIITYGYTARSDLNFSDKSENLVVNGSGFMVDNLFKVVDYYILGKKCRGDCRICYFCKEVREEEIQIKLH